MTKIAQLSRTDLDRMRVRGEYEEITKAQAAGKLNAILGVEIPDELESEGEYDLAWLKRAYVRRDYAAINAAAKAGKLNSVLKGSNNND
jgi:hypothetical protein